MKAIAYRIYKALQYARYTKNPAALMVLCRYAHLDFSLLETREGGRIFLKESDVEVTIPRFRFLLDGLDRAGRLHREAKAMFKALPGGVLLEIGGVKLNVQYWDELAIAEQIFARCAYNLKLDRPFVLIDVGMNVGTTSLFFANQEACRCVYAFELFPSTAAKAQLNFSLNPSLAKKIRSVSKGLAASRYTTQLEYVEEFKGSMGIQGVPDFVANNPRYSRRQKIQVEFLDCREVFPGILADHREEMLICKLDCEGAEYEILDALDKLDLLSSISVFMIEWHRKGSTSVEAVLRKNGFDLISFDPNASSGMLYAWRQAAVTA